MGWAIPTLSSSLQRRHNENDGVSNRLRLDWLLKRLFRHRLNKTSKLFVTGLSEGKSLVTDEFLTERARNAKNISIWWRHHDNTEMLSHSHKISECTYPCPYFNSSSVNIKTWVTHKKLRDIFLRAYGNICRPSGTLCSRGWLYSRAWIRLVSKNTCSDKSILAVWNITEFQFARTLLPVWDLPGGRLQNTCWRYSMASLSILL